MAADQYVAMRCSKCGGSLFYHNERKQWRCRHCGTFVNVYEDRNNDIKGIVRQILLDLAAGDIEKARKGLSDCEKRNHANVGTLIARMCINIEGTYSSEGAEHRTYASNMKSDMYEFWSKYRQLGPEQTKLLDSLGDDSADAFALLVFAFNCIKLDEHVDFCLKKFDVSRVRSPRMNGRLLTAVIGRGRADLIEKILKNSAHIDHAETLRVILDNYPAKDEESAKHKADFIRMIADRESIDPIYSRNAGYFEEYFTRSEDPFIVKIELLQALQKTDVRLENDIVWDSFREGFDEPAQMEEVLGMLFSKAVSNSEAQHILTGELSREGVSVEYIRSLLSFMKEKKAYATLNSKIILDFLGREDLSGSSKREILDFFRDYPVNSGVQGAVLEGYLCGISEEDFAQRQEVLEWLMGNIPAISTQTVEKYLLHCTIDGQEKPSVVQMILDHGFQSSFARDLLSDYMSSCPDDEKTQYSIFNLLKNAGFHIDPGIMNQYLSGIREKEKEEGESRPGMSQRDVLRTAMGTGMDPQADTLDNYIASLSNPDDYDPELVNLLRTKPFYLKTSTYCYYLLGLRDPAKVQNNRLFVTRIQGEPLSAVRINVNASGSVIEMNILQAYLVTGRDPYEIMASVTADLIGSGVNLREDILQGGTRCKFKKFIKEVESQLSPQCLQICRENRVFSFF